MEAGSIAMSTEIKSPPVPVEDLATGWKEFSQIEIAQTMLIRSIFPRQSYGLVVPHRAIRRISKSKINWFEYAAAYDLSNFYPFVSARISRTIFSYVRTTCNISARNFDFRLSRQHAIWEEMVGLFFTDVASARIWANLF